METQELDGVPTVTIVHEKITKSLVLENKSFKSSEKTENHRYILPYWPSWHEVGLTEIRRIVKDDNCTIAARGVQCFLDKDPSDSCNCKDQLSLVKDGIIFYDFPQDSVPASKKYEDFLKLGLCTIP